MAAIKLAKEKGAFVFGVCNVVGSSISRETHAGAYTHAGPEIGVASTKAFTTQITVLTLIALRLAKAKGTISNSNFHRYLQELELIPEKVAEAFIAKAVALAESIHAGAPGDGNYGPATMPSQISVISSHIKAAIKDGGHFAYGSLKSVHAPFVQPVILVDVPENSTALREETFGPIIIINRVANMREAIELSNASRYGLGANVWSKRQGKKIASQLHCGMVAINSTFSFAAISSVPFGGVKDSGYGCT